MGSIGTENEMKDMVITQVSFGGFDIQISAKTLAAFLENEIGIIWRCRLKNSWTPPESYPNFDVTNTANIQRTEDYERVEPHAFVHFASPEAVTRALNAAGRCELILHGNPLKVNLGPESSFRINKKRRTTIPFKFYDVRVEIGTLASRDEFLVGWKGPTSGVNFVIDPFDSTCKIILSKETVFSFKGMPRHAVINCDFKVEFPVREITEIKQYKGTSSLIMLLQLASSPHLFYRTAGDIHDTVPFDLLDDEDPWIRTTDFTLGGVIGRCSDYRISVSPRFGLNWEKAMNYLKERRIPNDCPRHLLRVQDEPDFGTPISDSFFCIQFKEGINFEIMFLVNVVMHKSIINQHQLSEKFFELLRSHTREVNVTALRHICS